ncbi:MAG: ABC transporter ATP-binding protein [Cyanobacteria bacterium P01_H01_bin.121]
MTVLSSPTEIAAPPELDVVNLTKQFGNLVALDQVCLTLKPGSFHALLGENGAGKSTLVKCIMGVYQPNAGSILVGKHERDIRNPRDAHHYGVGMVYQHFTSVPAMTVAENLVLARYDHHNVINWAQEYQHLEAFMMTAPFQVDLRTPIAQLAAGQKQKLEILKQLYLQSRILILDEPTSVLTPGEADEVLGLLRQEVSAGKLSVLLISHKFREVTQFADQVTILRKGRFAGAGRVADLSVADMAAMMIGDRRMPEPVQKATVANPATILEVRHLAANKDNGLPAIEDFNVTVRGGEIVGIAGVSGNGQRELIEVLSGQRVPHSGEILVHGEAYHATRREMQQHQIFSLPEEPLKNACVAGMSVAENLALRNFDRPPQARWDWLLVWRAIRQMATGLIQQFAVQTPSTETPIQYLSGGNVQRTVLARELSSAQIQLLIAANPCFGLDFAAVDFIHQQLLTARNRGVGVLLVSEDLDELLKLSDRLLVISEGRLAYEAPTATADLAAVSQRMAGH